MRMRSPSGRRRALVLAGAWLAATTVNAQEAPPPEPSPVPAPAPAPAPSATPAPAPVMESAPPAAPAPQPPPAPAQLDRVEVSAPRPDDTAERRQSTASKIVVGRDEIERYGDSTVGELLKRLPGVTMQGAPGRGGAIRMRGLGSGYTQILLDGERVPPGFSIDSLTPEQIERIEILRAPTAETGTRAIAGTINIVTREGFRKRINDLKLGVALENGQLSPELSWTRNDTVGSMIYNLSLTAFSRQRDVETDIVTVNQTLADGITTLAQNEQIARQERRHGLNLSGRLQWRGEPGESLVLTPFAVVNQGNSQTEALLTQSVGVLPPPYTSASAHGDSSYSMLRLSGQWNRRLAEAMRMEVRGGLGESRISGQSVRNEFGGEGGQRVIDDDGDIRDRSFNVNGKLFALVNGEHSIVSGAEFEGTRRNEERTTLQNGVPLLAEYGDNFKAATSRVALYAQNEWSPTPQWSAHAGLRWEALATTGDQADGSPLRNVSNVWSPIVHAVWKPEPKSRDQVRFSVTRSYRTPTLQNLIARPSISIRYPVPFPNVPSSPDRVGNPDLLPELATGFDIAFEHYPPAGGVLSANLFQRNIDNLIRSVTSPTPIDVPWSIAPRYVAQPQNIGSAVTQGLELEAKFRLTDLWPEALPLDVRANASLFRSRVDSVPGPDNRLDQQPQATVNLGADYRLRSVPLTLGANVNWNPSYTTRQSDVQTLYQGRKLVVDANALWVFTPGVQLRLTATNLAPADYLTGSTFDTEVERETAQNTVRTYIHWLLRLELKL